MRGDVVALVLTLAACVPGPGADQPLPLPDPDRFDAEVQPILAERCGNPACHGDPARPLSVHSIGGWRDDPADTFLDTPLTPAELRHDLASAAAFLVDVDRVLDCELVAKPLAEDAGGSGHAGGAQYLDRSEPEWLVLRGWVAGGLRGER